MVLEHFTVCYQQSITLQNFVFDKFWFIGQMLFSVPSLFHFDRREGVYILIKFPNWENSIDFVPVKPLFARLRTAIII